MSFAIAIMAAGKGTRLKSKRPKVLHEIGGKPLLRHVIDAALKVVPAKDIYVIVGHQAEQVRSAVASTGVHFVVQSEQRGTGHAVQAAAQAVGGYANLLVLSGDVPLLRTETILKLRDFHLSEQAAMTILTATPPDPTGYGRIKRRSKCSDEVEIVGREPAECAEVEFIVEQKSLTGDQHGLREINTGIYAFATGPLFEHIGNLEANNAHSELYLTDVAALLVKAQERVLAMRADHAEEVLGANTIAEMMELDGTMRRATTARLMAAGVTIFQPETVLIDAGVEVGADTVLEPFTQLLGSTRVGQDCLVRSYSVLENTTLADGVTIRHGCVIESSEIETGAIVGPYAHLRPESVVGEDAHVGNFVELKKTRLGRGSKAGHLSYLGDAVIGSGVNIGAGTIVCNYDGVSKHQTLIGDGVFVGSDSVLVAPLSIGSGAYVAAATCVTETVPENALAVGRARQVNKEGWATRRRAMTARQREFAAPGTSVPGT
jgi:bifunctional UDP-N-acetylglucosamine pyrophosphorylase/glucosamine-1-phosphate N-acetyltransferase